MACNNIIIELLRDCDILYSLTNKFMGLKKSHNTLDGVSHANSYWKVTDVNINHLKKIGRVVLEAWHTQADRVDKSPLAGVQRAVTITPVLYDEFFTSTVLDEVGKNSVERAYVLVTTANKIKLNTDEDGNDVFDNFFEGLAKV